VRIEFQRTVPLPAPAAAAWDFIGDIERVLTCVPNLSGLVRTGTDRYSATATDRVGPFRLSMEIALSVEIDAPARTIRAHLSGHDRKSQTRVSGTLTAGCRPADGQSTTGTVDAAGEVLGPVATLGAGPARRRIDQIFEEFVRCLTAGIIAAAEAPTRGS